MSFFLNGHQPWCMITTAKKYMSPVKGAFHKETSLPTIDFSGASCYIVPGGTSFHIIIASYCTKNVIVLVIAGIFWVGA